MLISFLALIVSMIPAFLIFWFLQNLYADEIYRAVCKKLILRGILSAVFVALLAAVLNVLWALSKLGEGRPLLNAAYHELILHAFVEELVKHLTANKAVKEKKTILSKASLIAFFALAALGFHIIESVIYFLDTNVAQILVRGVTGLHTSLGMLMGYYVGKSIETGKKGYRILGFFFAWAIHGVYDLALSEELQAWNEFVILLPLLMVLIAMILLIRFLLKLRKEKKNEGPWMQPLV